MGIKLKNKYQKLLMICYAYPPYHAIGAVRTENLSKEFLKYFPQVNVISTTNIPTDKKNTQIEYIKVRRARTFDYDVLRKYFSKFKSKKKSETQKGVPSTKISFSTKLINTFPFSIILGLGGIVYILHAIFLALREADNETIIFTSYPPLSDHIVGYFVKLRYPRSYWIADYRDALMLTTESISLAQGLDTMVHKKILNKADLTTVISDGLRIHFENFTPHVKVIRNSAVLSQNPEYEQAIKMEKFRIVYTGRLYQHKRNPSSLFDAVEELIEEGNIDKARFEIVHAGPESLYWNNHAEKYSFTNVDLGLVSREEARKLQNESNILLMINWNLPNLLGCLSGKLFEYFEIGNPVLAIIDGQVDKEMEYIFDDLNAGLVSYVNKTEIQEIKDFVLKYYQLWLEDSMSEKVIDREKLRKYSWKRVVHDFLESQEVA